MTTPVQVVDAVAALAAAAPPGVTALTGRQLADLRSATAALVDTCGASGRTELDRFQQIGNRQLAVDHAPLRELHAGRTVLVTGGTGCIGSSLVRELTQLGPRRIISVSRGRAQRWPRSAGVDYLHVDLRDRQAVFDLFSTTRPEIVYHLAAQHDPGLAEKKVNETISTNVTGTINIVDACRRSPGIRLACASTGKALRPFSRDVYAASKKMTEWILRQAARQQDLLISAVRFTHVVDNSIILERLRGWNREGTPIRLHSVDSMFYLQSAREAAQLLLSSVLEPSDDGLALGAIRDLGWPASLLELALGVISAPPTDTPLYVCGFEAGYEKAPYPGLYDPLCSGSRSPLFNAMEVPEVSDSTTCPAVDIYQPPPSTADRVSRLIRRAGADACASAPPEIVRAQIEECGWTMLRESLALMPTTVLARQCQLLHKRNVQTFSNDDSRIHSLVNNELDRRLTLRDVSDHGFRRGA